MRAIGKADLPLSYGDRLHTRPLCKLFAGVWDVDPTGLLQSRYLASQFLYTGIGGG
jgi:hypothetical protein